jgi:hypothetical protein
MTIEDELRALPGPPALPPPADLADAVLRGVRRRRARTAVAAAAVLVAAAVAVPVATLRGGGPDRVPARPAPTGSAPTEPAPTGPRTTRLTDLPGGPVTITAFTVDDTGRTWVLDPATGAYAEVPYAAAVVSPDGRRVAVSDGRRTGLADVGDLGRVRWTGLAGGRPAWSPDGRRLLVTAVDRGSGLVYRLQALTVATGAVRTTRLVNPPIVGDPAWAADSADFLVARRVYDDPDGAPLVTAPQVVHPDGTFGATWLGTGGRPTFSPSGARAAVDPSDLPVLRPTETSIVDTRTGDRLTGLPAGATHAWPKTAGWYDESSVVRLQDAPELSVVDATTGAIRRVVRLPSLPPLSAVQLGPRTGAAPGF